ncbi:hypothetical protein [Lentimicrobium sp.]|jgi:hypothetical protein|uniref:hypothetical protein n=1 Tax=Lentimicrobium sp. TaxID=2034841 RepID=UPI0025DD5ED7|nr:hypothetical protein [Lentimicrobium sp.]MCO5255426.1 hypothetical protein [Lentimicrobium sp.]MCO5261733.1 hypothetical protein [Lentimicrobium sp.]HOP13394.1 hypothetical protein [Lentimicrobium sp.]HPF63233.1 hypothetical protein [Lentimicrobium sp.]HPJ61049.1 hypothetical protein [Lentimicrobium sp.]
MKIVAFKTGKPKSFNYRPLFYDKKKEEMEERLKRYTKPEEVESERLKLKIRETWRRRDSSNRQASQRTFYIYIIAAILLLYFIFFR